jgi:curli production assembly/transport component CsgG
MSKGIDVGLFRFVRLKRLLEVETGITTNEPPQMCVLEAIEKAVQSLIIEGIIDHLWTLKNPSDIDSPLISSYLEEKKNRQTHLKKKQPPKKQIPVKEDEEEK